VAFLHMAAEAAGAGSRILTALRKAEATGTALTVGQDRLSRLPGSVGLLCATRYSPPLRSRAGASVGLCGFGSNGCRQRVMFWIRRCRLDLRTFHPLSISPWDVPKEDCLQG
jgi:hypothetical protein